MQNQVIGQDVNQIIKGMMEKTRSLKTLSYSSSAQERFDGRMKKFSSSCVIQRKPFRLYYRQKSPNDGLELLFREDRDKGNVWVNPNGFPYITLHLNIDGTHLRKNRHHSIYEADIAYVAELLAHLSEKYSGKTASSFKLKGSKIFDGHDCWVIELDNPEFKIIPYKVNQPISPIGLSRKLKISLYKILELNPKLVFDKNMKIGQVLNVPTDYGSSMEIWIDKIREIPLKLQISDEVGLFEYYEFSNVILDPVLPPETYRPGNPNYHFK